MAGPPLFVIVDDKRTDSIFFGPTDWNTSTLASSFNGTLQAPGFATNGSDQFGTIFMKFQGTSVAFFGTTPSNFTGSQILTVSIDGSQPTNTSYQDPNPPSYRQWYQSPTLTEGSHQISLGHIAGTSLDFAVVAVGNDTPLAGQIAIVDNEDPTITFKGNWTRSGDEFHSGQFPDGLPFHNSTQDSTTIGDNFTFRFTGQSAAIYGIFTWSNLGIITLTFTMDGSSLSRTFQVTTTTSQYQTNLGSQQNFQFFSYDFLPPGNHTLVVNVTDCVNQTFNFDYITFTPSFSTLATRPNLTSSNDTGSSSSSKNLSAGAIAGIVIAVLAVLIGGILFSRWRLRKTKSTHNLIQPFLPGRRDAEFFPLNDTTSLSSTSVMSGMNNAIRSTDSNRYGPIPVADVDAQLPANEPPTFISANSYNSGEHADPFTSGYIYDQHGNRENGITAVGGGELVSPPSYAESTRLVPVRTAIGTNRRLG